MGFVSLLDQSGSSLSRPIKTSRLATSIDKAERCSARPVYRNNGSEYLVGIDTVESLYTGKSCLNFLIIKQESVLASRTLFCPLFEKLYYDELENL
jgi:hypothetical protein